MPVDFRQSHQFSRRLFLGAALASPWVAKSARAAMPASEQIRVGFIGYGLIGKRHVVDFLEQPDMRVTAVAECHRGRLDEAIAHIKVDGRHSSVKAYSDFRRLLDDRDVDAVIVSTPDHWHALTTILACAAGKDVYVEKPLTLFQREGRWMLDVAGRSGRVVQVGTQQRSGHHYQRARDLIRGGAIGRVHSVRFQACRNIMPGFGRPADTTPPAELDWDMFQGPAPEHAYNPNRGIYHFRWFWDYSGGQMTNLGAHQLDIIDWFLSPVEPRAVYSIGGRFSLQDNGETPDTQDALFQLPDYTASWTLREASRGGPVNALEFFGEKGSLTISRRGFKITPDTRLPPENMVPQFTGAHPVGGPQRVATAGPSQTWTEVVEDNSGDDREQFGGHVRNFLDCIKSRATPISDLASAHRTATACHLANISLRLGRQVRWDAKQEMIIGDEEAAAMLVRPYRKPWDAELRALVKNG